MFASWRDSRNSFVALHFVLLVIQLRLFIILTSKIIGVINQISHTFSFQTWFLTVAGNMIEF